MTMTRTALLPFFRTQKLQVVELAYQDPTLVVDLLLPDTADGFAELERDLAMDRLRTWFDGLAPTPIELRLPRFSLRSFADLGPALRGLGIGELLSAKAAPSSGQPLRSLKFGRVIEETLLVVNEAGSGVERATKPDQGQPREPTVVTVARPFLLIVREMLSGTLLLVARVVDPGAP